MTTSLVSRKGSQLLTRRCRRLLSSEGVRRRVVGDSYISGSSTHFGFDDVAVDEKEGKVRQVFDNVADSYDVMNDLMSGGLHRNWKDYLLEVSAVPAMARAVRRTEGRHLRILDVAGGTGDIAFRFVDAAENLERSRSSGEDTISVTVCDINSEMLRVGERRARERYGNQLLDSSKALRFVEGNAQGLQFESDSFDLYTIAFGLRNVTDVDLALAEAYRVLKPGGRFMCLEFSRVSNTFIRRLYDEYSFHAIPLMGHLVAGDHASYRYLVESIRRFSNQDDLVQRIRTAGFEQVKFTNLSCGIVALHEGWKMMRS